MTSKVPELERKKHRHDLGHEDHHAAATVRTTGAIQVLLGLWIVLTLSLVIYALATSGRGFVPID
jgi:hypothetical protein